MATKKFRVIHGKNKVIDNPIKNSDLKLILRSQTFWLKPHFWLEAELTFLLPFGYEVSVLGAWSYCRLKPDETSMDSRSWIQAGEESLWAFVSR